MKNTIRNLVNFILSDLYLTILFVCLFFILIYGLYCRLSNIKGSYSKQFFNPYESVSTNKAKAKSMRKVQFNDDISIEPDKHGESSGERKCRETLQKIFNRPFNKIRPNFLNNVVTGSKHNLELDCYDKQLGLAVEYNGRQHYDYVPFFHTNKEAFLNQKYRDELKRRMCVDNNVILIEVPYTVKVEDIEEYIVNELKMYKRFQKK